MAHLNGTAKAVNPGPSPTEDDGPPIVFRIRDWKKVFETHDSRKYRSLTWVSMPNSHDGKGYRRMVRSPRAAEIFGAWIAIVQVASKCPIRGVLADRDGPLTCNDLADKTGFPAEVFEFALSFLSDPYIGWIEQLEQDPLPGGQPAVPGDAGLSTRRDGLRNRDKRDTDRQTSLGPPQQRGEPREIQKNHSTRSEFALVGESDARWKKTEPIESSNDEAKRAAGQWFAKMAEIKVVRIEAAE